MLLLFENWISAIDADIQCISFVINRFNNIFLCYLNTTGGESGDSRGICDYLLTFISILFIICTFPIAICFSIKVG